jgi:hypothetical protein
MKINREFFNRYVALEFPIFGPYRGKKWKEFKKLITEMGYDVDEDPSGIDNDFQDWGMINDPETTKKYWEMSDEEFARDLEVLVRLQKRNAA